MPRGPKTKTARNTSPRHKELIRHETLEPPCDLTEAARAEYDRLIAVLSTKGTMDRVDLGVVAEAARIKDELDIAHVVFRAGRNLAGAKLVGLFTSQRRGLLRELGLTTAPNRSVVRANPVPAEKDDDPVAGKIRLA